VKAKKISLLRPDGKQALAADNLSFNADFIGLLRKENIISGLELESPYLLLETGKKGEIVFPFLEVTSQLKTSGIPSVLFTSHLVRCFADKISWAGFGISWRIRFPARYDPYQFRSVASLRLYLLFVLDFIPDICRKPVPSLLLWRYRKARCRLYS
jgi:hypothetical protein